MDTLPKEPFWLAAIIDGSGVGTWLWNVQTGETRFNNRWAEIIGYTLEELEPISIETWMFFAHPDDLEHSSALLEAHFKGETEFYHCEARMRHKNGHWVWVRDHGKVVSRTANGEPEWMAGSHLDITVEKEQRLSLERLDKIAKTIPGVIYEFRMDEHGNGTFPYASSGIELIYGVSPEQAKQDASLVYKAIHSDDLALVEASIAESYDSLEEWYCEYRTIVNGEEKWVTGYAIPEKNADGSVSWFGQIVDTTYDKGLELELKESHQNLERAQRIGKLGYWRANMKTGELYWSDMIYDMFGVEKGQFEPSVEAFSNAVHPEDIELVRESERKAMVTGMHDVVHRIIQPNGEIRWVHELADMQVQNNNNYLVGTVRDVTEQKKYELDLERLSLTDSLTGAYNRRYFDSRLTAIFHQVKTRDVQVAVATFDLDHFKKVNDTYGHAVGDTVLKDVVKIANDVFRSTDVFARTGGEEFTVLLVDCAVEQAAERLEELSERIASKLFYNGEHTFRISITGGLSQIMTTDNGASESIERADNALYKGKTSGRNQIVLG